MKTKHTPIKRKIPKEVSDVTDFIMAFIRRNNREQDVPKGYKSLKEMIEIFGCTPRGWGRIFNGLVKTKSIEYIKLRRVDNNKIKRLSYYKIDDKLFKAVLKKK